MLNSETNLVVTVGSPITPGTILPGVTYSTPITTAAFFFFNIDTGGGFPGGFLDTASGPNPLTVQFVSPQTAFGFDTNSLMGPSFDITINFSTGGSFSDTLTIPNTLALTGFGFISSADDIMSAVIFNPNSPIFSPANPPVLGFAIDNFTYASPIPEPASLTLLGSSLVVFRLIRRRGWKMT